MIGKAHFSSKNTIIPSVPPVHVKLSVVTVEVGAGFHNPAKLLRPLRQASGARSCQIPEFLSPEPRNSARGEIRGQESITSLGSIITGFRFYVDSDGLIF